MRLFTGTREQSGAMGKNLLEVKGGESKRARVEPGVEGLINVLEPK